MSHPTGVRGLKFTSCYNAAEVDLSHPTGVRGLKSVAHAWRTLTVVVAPHWGAWIEIYAGMMIITRITQSHPTGVRGLKFHAIFHD